MLILGIDTTGKTLSVGLSDGEKPLGEIFISDTKKHSETLLPAIDSLLSISSYDIKDVDIYAVSIGPGSFTGIRIGAGCAIGLAQANSKKTAQVDTLKALCANICTDSAVCAIMDARRGEVYAAAYEGDKTIIEPCALSVNKLLAMLDGRRMMFVGDGVDVYGELIAREYKNAVFAPQQLRYQRGLSVCKIGHTMAESGNLSDYTQVSPKYMRKSQAERMRDEKLRGV